MSEEKVDIKKFAKGFIQPVEWWKATSTGIKVGIILLLIYFIWQVFFLKKNTQNTQIREVKGNVNIISKPSRFFIPFIEGGVEKSSKVDFDTYIRGGLRFEF